MKTTINPLSPRERVRVREILQFILLSVILLQLSACGSPPPAVVPTKTSLPPTASPTETDTPTAIPATPVPQDPALFGAIGISEIQSFALEPIADAIFSRTLA